MTVDRIERVAMPERKWYWVAGAVGVTYLKRDRAIAASKRG